MERLSSTCPEDFRREKNFRQFFFQKCFRTLREKFPDLWRTFGRQGLQKKPFVFCQRNFVTRNNFFQVNEITIKIFCSPTVSFIYFWLERLAGILDFNYLCPEEFSAEKLLFHKISYFHEFFRTLGKQYSKLCPTLFGRAIKKTTCVSGGTLWRKTKCFSERCFYNCFRTLIGKVCTFEKKFRLGVKTLFYVSRGTFLEKSFV